MTKKPETPFVPLIGGIVQVTGDPDAGKTSCALECGPHPSRIAVVDDDEKTRATAEQVARDIEEFAEYIDFKKETKGLPQLGVYGKGVEIIERLEKRRGDLDAIVWDTWTRFASTMKAHVRKNPHLFREPRDWAPLGSMKGAQQWKEAQELEAQMLARLNDIAPIVIVVTHLRDQYAFGKKTGKMIPDASKTITRVPRFRVWLRRNPSGSPIPIGLVLKRVDVKEYIEGKGLRTINVLPLRLVPQEGDRSIWDIVARYMQDPIGTREPQDFEIPNAFERSLIEGTLTDDQKRALMFQLQADAGDETEVEELPDEVINDQQFVHDMRADGASDREIARSLKENLGKSYVDIAKAFGNGFTVPEIVAMLEEKE
jgi:hypothetical protein